VGVDRYLQQKNSKPTASPPQRPALTEVSGNTGEPTRKRKRPASPSPPPPPICSSPTAAFPPDLKALLNQLYLRPQPAPTKKAGKPGKSGRQQIEDNAENLLSKAVVAENVAAAFLGLKPCLESTASTDGRDRPVRSMRVRVANGGPEIKREFRAYHVTWVSAYGQIPDTTLQYSHRCHNGKCVEPTHGTWDTDQENKARNACQNHSHLQLPNGAFIQLCPHTPICLSAAKAIKTWDDPRVVQPPLGLQS
jgi:hypothetical protein